MDETDFVKAGQPLAGIKTEGPDTQPNKAGAPPCQAVNAVAAANGHPAAWDASAARPVPPGRFARTVGGSTGRDPGRPPFTCEPLLTMRHHLKDLYGARISGPNGDIGRIQDFYFEAETWAVRYFVAHTGTGLAGRRVLISPHAIDHLDLPHGLLMLNLTQPQIDDSPSIDTSKPFSRQFELAFHRYYGYPKYWSGPALWGFSECPASFPASVPEWNSTTDQEGGDPNLWSTRDVTGYQMQALDGKIGLLSGFVVDDRNWAIDDFVVDAGPWDAGKEILIRPRDIGRLIHHESRIMVNLTREQILGTQEHETAIVGAGLS